jgi:single-stranded DNA-binding protein
MSGWARAYDTRMGTGKHGKLTTWHSLSFYGELADVGQALKKRDNIYVDGRIEQRQFIGARRN